MTSESAQFLVCRSTEWYRQHHFEIFVLVQTILTLQKMTSQQVVYLKSLDTLWLTWLTTKWKFRKLSIYFPQVPPTKEPPTIIRSSYSTPLPLQSISFITSSSNSQSRTQKKLKTFPLPGTATELTRVTVAHTNPTESDQRQRVWPTHCAKSLTNVHAYLRTDLGMYVRTCEVSRQVARRYAGM